MENSKYPDVDRLIEIYETCLLRLLPSLKSFKIAGNILSSIPAKETINAIAVDIQKMYNINLSVQEHIFHAGIKAKSIIEVKAEDEELYISVTIQFHELVHLIEKGCGFSFRKCIYDTQ